MTPAISLRAVGKHYAVQGDTVQALALTMPYIAAGEPVVLPGRSGCGKTTLLRLVAGLVKPSEGRIAVGGRDLRRGERGNAAAVQELGVVFQDANLFPRYTIKRASPAAWPRELSGGMRQRAAIARALSYDPHVLFAVIALLTRVGFILCVIVGAAC